MQYPFRVFPTLLGLLLAVLCLTGVPARAAATGEISGLVRDSSGRVLPGATVLVTLRGLSAAVRANADGVYTLSNLPPAAGYTLRARATRHLTAERSPVTVLADQKTRIDFALTPAAHVPSGSIVGLVQTATGARLAGAHVEVLRGPKEARATSGRLGTFRLSHLLPGTYSLSVSSLDFETQILNAVAVRSGQATILRVRLEGADESAPGGFFGVVRDHLGHPLPGARVEIVQGPGAGETIAGDGGAYELGDLPAGEYAIRASAKGHWGATWDGVVLEAGHAIRVDFSLHRQGETPRFGSIAGIVTDLEGHPLAGAVLEIAQGPTRRRAVTGENGRYALEELLPGAYVVDAGREGYEPKSADGRVGAGQRLTLNFSLRRKEEEPRFGSIAGRVTDREGHPLAGALVEIIDGPTRRRVETNEEGRYVLEELLPGHYFVRASKHGFHSKTGDPHVTAGQRVTLDFALERTPPARGRIVGHVRNGEGHGIPQAKVKIVQGPVTREVFTNADGRYELLELPPGNYRLVASKEGWLPAESDLIELGAGQVKEVNFTLRRSHARIVGHVRNGEGHGIPQAKVKIVQGPVTREVFTNADGRYVLEELPPGVYRLLVTREGFLPADTEPIELGPGQVKEVNFTLRRSFGRIVGVVRGAAEEPLREVRVEIIAGEGRGRHVFTNAHGEYSLNELLPGTYSLRFSREGLRPVEVTGIVVKAGEATRKDVRMEPGS